MRRARKARQQARGFPAHHELYLVLSDELARGANPAGSKLPTEIELAREYAISRWSVRLALTQLVRDQRILRIHGRGAFARTPARAAAAMAVPSAPLEDLARLECDMRSQLIEFRISRAPPWLRGGAPSSAAERCLHVRRVRSYEGAPFALVEEYIPERLAAGISRKRLGSRPMTHVLRELGIRPRFGEQVTTAIAAGLESASRLKVALGAPLLEIRRSVHAHDGELVQFQCCIIRPDRFQLRTLIDPHAIRAGGRRRVQPQAGRRHRTAPSRPSQAPRGRLRAAPRGTSLV